MTKKNHRTIKDLEYKAKSGDVKSAFQLYEYYQDGSFVEQDEVKSEFYANRVLELFEANLFHVSKLKLVDYRGFKDIELRFGKHESSPLTILVGINGSGKTTILDALSGCLSWLILRIVRQPNSGKAHTLTDEDIHKGNKEIADYTSVSCVTSYGSKLEYSAELAKTRKGSKASRSNEIEEMGQLGRLYKLIIHKQPQKNLPIIAYYGVNRTVEFSKRTIDKKIDNIGEHNERMEAYKSSLDANIDFVEFFHWFKRTQEISKLEDGSVAENAEAALSYVKDAIKSILPDFDNIRIQRSPSLDMLIEKNGVTLSVSQLSQGEKSLIALVFDITKRLILLNPDLKELGGSPLNGVGIVLIDEIELHLHPEWQQKVVPSLITTFPNIQFILTTHSPQVITTVPSDCIMLLNDGVINRAPKGTKGAESSRVLKRVFGVKTRPKDDENTKLLEQYLDRVFNDNWDEESTLELRNRLDNIFQGEEPELDRADLYIENRKWELSLEKN